MTNKTQKVTIENAASLFDEGCGDMSVRARMARIERTVHAIIANRPLSLYGDEKSMDGVYGLAEMIEKARDRYIHANIVNGTFKLVEEADDTGAVTHFLNSLLANASDEQKGKLSVVRGALEDLLGTITPDQITEASKGVSSASKVRLFQALAQLQALGASIPAPTTPEPTTEPTPAASGHTPLDDEERD